MCWALFRCWGFSGEKCPEFAVRSQASEWDSRSGQRILPAVINAQGGVSTGYMGKMPNAILETLGRLSEGICTQVKN